MERSARSGARAVALVGALAHAIAAGTPSEHRRLLLVALALWPALTAPPAFLAALIAGSLLRRSAKAGTP